MYEDEAVLRDGAVVGVRLGALSCDLPAPFCLERVRREAAQEGKSVLAWWRDLSTMRPIARKALEAAVPIAERIGKDDKEQQRAFAIFRVVLDHMAKLRTVLDNGKPHLSARVWSKATREWYGWMAALSMGLTPRDSMSGKPMLPRGMEDVEGIGGVLPILHDVEATYYDGINLGAAIGPALRDGTPVEDSFGVAPILVGVLVGVLALAVGLWLWPKLKDTLDKLERAVASARGAIESVQEAGTAVSTAVPIIAVVAAVFGILALASARTSSRS